MRITFLILFTIFVGVVTKAQSIKVIGTVNDTISKQALPNATIIITGLNNFKTITISNKKGVFNTSVVSAGVYSVEVNYVGYKKIIKDSVLIDEVHSTIPTFFLTLENNYLQKVTVTSAKPFIVMGTNKITLNVSQSAIAAGSNAYEVILKAPGIIEQNEQLNFKGKSVNIYINGRPSQISGSDLKNMLTNMQANNIEKVEIMPNPSAKFDAQGGSVINIVLAKNKSYGTNYTLTTTVGTGRQIRTSNGIDFNSRNKKVNVYGGYTYANNQQYFTDISTRNISYATLNAEEYDLRKRNNNSYKLGLDYDFSKKSSMGFLINGYKNFRERMVTNSSTLHYNNSSVDSLATVNTFGKAIFSSPTINLYYKTKSDSTDKELTINADYIHYNKSWHDNFTNNYYDEKGQQYVEPNFLRDNSPANINVFVFSADYVQPTKNGKWEAGIKSTFSNTDNDVLWENKTTENWITDKGKTNHFIYKENVNAAYVNYSRTIKKWSIETGLRAEQTNTNGNSLTANTITKNNYVSWFPNVGVEFAKNKMNVLGFSYRKSIQRFGFDYVNPFIVYQSQYAYSQGNPLIQPQINHAFEMSYVYKQAYSFSLSYIRGIKSLGELYLQAPNNVTISSYGNFNSNDIFYFSAYGSKKLFKKWTITLVPVVGYIALNNASNGIAQGDVKKILLTQLNWQNSIAFKKGVTAELNFNYVSPYQYGSYTTKLFFNSSFGLSKPIFKNKVTARLSVSDIFNTVNSNKELDYDGIKSSVRYKPESRFINLTLRYKFGNKNVKAKARNQSKTSDVQNRIK
jgi:iron complex outermembrane recepter protein